jgi:hypothetical protein
MAELAAAGLSEVGLGEEGVDRLLERWPRLEQVQDVSHGAQGIEAAGRWRSPPVPAHKRGAGQARSGAAAARWTQPLD